MECPGRQYKGSLPEYSTRNASRSTGNATAKIGMDVPWGRSHATGEAIVVAATEIIRSRYPYLGSRPGDKCPIKGITSTLANR